MEYRYVYLLLDLLDAMAYDSKVEIDDAALAIFEEKTSTTVTEDEMQLALDLHSWIADWISENGGPAVIGAEGWSAG